MSDDADINKFKIEISALSDTSSDEEPENNNLNIIETPQEIMPIRSEEPLIEERFDKRGRRMTQKRLQAIRDTGYKNKQKLTEIRQKAALFDKMQHLLPKEIDYDKITSEIVEKIRIRSEPAPKPAPAKQEPQPAPAKQEPQPAPAKQEPQPAPAKQEPPAPAKQEPQPAPAKQEPQPAKQEPPRQSFFSPPQIERKKTHRGFIF